MLALKDKIINKKSAWLFLTLSVISISLVLHQIFSYKYLLKDYLDEYYPFYTNNNVSGLNTLAYFTELSITSVAVLFFVFALAGFGVKWAKKALINPALQMCVTEYIFITGVVYCTALLWLMRFFPWNSPLALVNVASIWNHFLMPVFVTCLWFFPVTRQTIPAKQIGWTVVFPVAYGLLSIVRGVVIGWYPYPFFDVNQLWQIVFGNKRFDALQASLMVVGVCIALTAFMVLVAVALRAVHNKLVARQRYGKPKTSVAS